MTNYFINDKEKEGKDREEKLKKSKDFLDFQQYIIKKYGAKGRRSIRFSPRLDELDILLGVRDASRFDDEDKSYLDEEQLETLEKLSKKEDLGKFKDGDYGQMGYHTFKAKY